MHEPRVKDLPECIGVLSERGIESRENILLYILGGLLQNQMHIYSLFAGTPPAEPRRRGAIGITPPPSPLRFVGEVRMQTTGAMGVPAQRWTNTIGSVAQRNFLPVHDAAMVDAIVGVVHVESMRDQSQHRQHVWLTRTQGSGIIPARHLIAVTVRFLRYRGADNGRFAIYLYAVAPSGVAASGDTVLDGSETVYESSEVVLPPALQTDYDISATPRGAGLKLLHAQLALFAR